MMRAAGVNVEEHASKILSDLHRMQRDRVGCDLIIKAQNDLYCTHRIVMSSGSEYIRNKLAQTSNNDQVYMIYFGSLNSECMKCCIDFIYSGQFEIPEGKIENLLEAGTILQLGGMRQLIAVILAGSLNVESYFSTRNMAGEYKLEELSMKCQRFFEENHMEIANRPEFGRMSMAEVVHLLLAGERKFTEHDKLVVLLIWAEQNPQATGDVLDPIQRVKLDRVPQVFLRSLLKSHVTVSNDFAIYKWINDHLLETPENVSREYASDRSDGAKKSQVQGNSSGFVNPHIENNAQSRANNIRNIQIVATASPAFPASKPVRNLQTVVPKNAAHVTVRMPLKRKTYFRRCKTTKVSRLHENRPNIALLEALMNLLRHKKPNDVAIDHKGFAYVEDILKHPEFQQFSLSGTEIYDMVKKDDKSPFAVKGRVDDFQIRATWGHTFELESERWDQRS